MFLLSTCLLLLSSACICSGRVFMKSEKSPRCIFNYLDAVFNSAFQGQGTRYHNETYQICCPFNQPYVLFNPTKRSRKNCCAIPSAREYSNLLTRPCAFLNYFTFMRARVKNYVPSNDPAAPYNKYKCLNDNRRDSDSFRRPRDDSLMQLVRGVTDKRENCADRRRRFQVKFYFTARTGISDTRNYLYSWCCARDIFKDYTLDPRKECCGLSGSLSPFYSRIVDESRGGHPGVILRDNPPCCRTQARKELCEPLPLYDGVQFASRICPPFSGLANVTSNLMEDIPNFAPSYYAFKEGSVNNYDLFTESRCQLNSHPFFYTFRNVLNAYFAGFKEEYGLCCTRRNMFAESVQTVTSECCITYTGNSNSINKAFKLPCNSDRGGVKDQSLFFKQCVPGGCSEDNQSTLSTDSKFRVIQNYTVNKLFEAGDNQLAPPLRLYGSDFYFWEKNTVPRINGVTLQLLAQ